MAADSGFDPWHLIHVLWAGLGGIIVWNGKQLFKRIDLLEKDKADEDDVKIRHLENSAKFDRMLQQLDSLGHDLRLHREELNGSIHKMSLDVNTLMERSRAALSKEDREGVATEERASGRSKK